MSQKRLLFVKVFNRLECIEYNQNTSSEDLKETLRTAAEANTNDILKLYNSKGNLVSISNAIDENNAKEPYRLEIIVKNISCHSVDLKDLAERVEQLEYQLHSMSTTSEYEKVEELHKKVNELCQKLENLEHLSWLGLFKENRIYSINNSQMPVSIRAKKKDKSKEVYEKFKKYSLIQVSDETKEYLKTCTFDNWKFEESEMLILLQQMYIDLELTSKFGIKTETLQAYLFEIFMNYNDVPFHNFRHAFTVTQMMYGLIFLTKLTSVFDPLEILALLIAAVSHDLDHDGYNNSYQINAGTTLALIYNDQSPLENYHCAVAFHILNKLECNILSSLDRQSYRKIREYIIQIILATDMTNHAIILDKFKSIVDVFDFKNPDHRLQLMKILMKIADISNECRPANVSEMWLDCLLAEFFNQGDHEKLKGLPLSPLTDRETFSRASSQIGFISFALLPLAESLSRLFPQINNSILKATKESLEYYKQMKAKTVTM